MSRGAKVKRSGKRPTVKPRPRKQDAKPGMIARIAAILPFSPQTIQRGVTIGLAGLIGVALFGVAIVAGLPKFVGVQLAQAVGRAGFEVKRVEVTGIDRMERLTVYAIVLDQQSMAMPLVDLEKVRSQLLRFGWIEEARVSRRLPDTLVVDIVERTPAAIWQRRGKLSLIDGKGVVLEKVSVNAMPDLPLVIGEQANFQAVALGRLLDRAPSLKKALTAATWVGDRRWDLQFETGETLALPEGEEASAKALLQFARMEGVQRLLGRGFARFDMRDPTRFVARVSRSKPAIEAPITGKSQDQAENSNGPA